MNEFSEGDLIEATKGEQVIRARAKGNGGEPALSVAGGFYWLSSLRRDGYTLTLIEKAVPALPTEEGWYTDKHDDLWRRTAGGHWFIPGADKYDGCESEFAPFARLEPVADTAKKVLDAIDAALTDRNWSTSSHAVNAVWAEVAKEFGVTK